MATWETAFLICQVEGAASLVAAAATHWLEILHAMQAPLQLQLVRQILVVLANLQTALMEIALVKLLTAQDAQPHVAQVTQCQAFPAAVWEALRLQRAIQTHAVLQHRGMVPWATAHQQCQVVHFVCPFAMQGLY